MKKKYNYIYITTNLMNGKQYVGDRSCNCDPEKDSYLGSGIYFKKAKKKYGKNFFERKILEFFNTKQEAFDAQEKYINEYNTLVPNGYNISPKGGVGTIGCFSKKTKEKMSKSHKGQIPWNKGKTGVYTKEMLKKMVENRDYTVSKETRKKLSIVGKGRKKSEEWKEKIRQSLIGIKHSEERIKNVKKGVQLSKKRKLKYNNT